MRPTQEESFSLEASCFDAEEKFRPQFTSNRSNFADVIPHHFSRFVRFVIAAIAEFTVLFEEVLFEGFA